MVPNLRRSLLSDALRFYLWRWKKNEVCKTEVYTRDELLARILEAAASIKLITDRPHSIFTHEFRSALRLTVRFWNIYCEL